MTTKPSGNRQRLKDLAMSTTEVFHLRHDQLTPGDIQAREDFEDVGEWAEANILPAGRILQPLLVKKEKGGIRIDIQDGERRWRGVGHLIAKGLVTADFPIPCISEPKPVGQAPTRADRLLIPLLANSGKHLNMVEKGRQYVRLMAEGLSMAEVARRLPGKGVSKQSISNDVFLVTKGAPGLLDLVRQGKLAPTTALEIAKQHPDDHAAQEETAQAALSSAAGAGRTHATPKDLPAKLPPATPPSLRWATVVLPVNTNVFDATGHADPAYTDACTVTGFPLGCGLVEITLRVAKRPEAGAWAKGYTVNTGAQVLGQPVTCLGMAHDSQRDAWMSAWEAAFDAVFTHFGQNNDEPAVALLRALAPDFVKALDAWLAGPREGSPDRQSEIADPQSSIASLSFAPHILVGRPPECSGAGDYQEKYRFVLQGMPTECKLERCHLLLSPLEHDPALYAVGYRYEIGGVETEVLPNHAIDGRIIDASKLTLHGAVDHLMDALHEEPQFDNELLSPIEEAWGSAILATETSSNEEIALGEDYAFDDSKFETLAWVAKADPKAVEEIKAAANTNRDGSGVGAGNNGGYADPSKRVNEAEKLLEELAGTVHAKTLSYTVTEIVLGFINGTRSRAELRNVLTQSL